VAPVSPAPKAAPKPVDTTPKAKKRKLSYKESAELKELPDRIASAEAEREAAFAQLADPGVLRDGPRVIAVQAQVATLDAELERLMARWEELETIASEATGG
jgi:ATP-binding cassette subfamily F protein uup